MIKLHQIAQLSWPGPTTDESKAYSNVLTLLLALLGSASLIIIIYAGFRLITSRGNPEAIGKLRSTLLYAAIGLFVALSAGAIVGFVTSRLG